MTIIGSRCFGGRNEMTVDEFKNWLHQYDRDKNGCISEAELREAIQSRHVWFGRWKARQGMNLADANGNRLLDSPEEMDKLIRFAEKRLHMKIINDN